MILRSLVPAAVPTVLKLTRRATVGIAGPADDSEILAFLAAPSHLPILVKQPSERALSERAKLLPAHHYYPDISILPPGLQQIVLLQATG